MVDAPTQFLVQKYWAVALHAAGRTDPSISMYPQVVTNKAFQEVKMALSYEDKESAPYPWMCDTLEPYVASYTRNNQEFLSSSLQKVATDPQHKYDIAMQRYYDTHMPFVKRLQFNEQNKDQWVITQNYYYYSKKKLSRSRTQFETELNQLDLLRGYWDTCNKLQVLQAIWESLFLSGLARRSKGSKMQLAWSACFQSPPSASHNNNDIPDAVEQAEMALSFTRLYRLIRLLAFKVKEDEDELKAELFKFFHLLKAYYPLVFQDMARGHEKILRKLDPVMQQATHTMLQNLAMKSLWLAPKLIYYATRNEHLQHSHDYLLASGDLLFNWAQLNVPEGEAYLIQSNIRKWVHMGFFFFNNIVRHGIEWVPIPMERGSDEMALCLSKLPDLYFMWITMDFVVVLLGGLLKCREANFVQLHLKGTLIVLSWDAITLVLCWCALSSEFRIDMAREFHMSYRRLHHAEASSWHLGLFAYSIATGIPMTYEAYPRELRDIYNFTTVYAMHNAEIQEIVEDVRERSIVVIPSKLKTYALAHTAFMDFEWIHNQFKVFVHDMYRLDSTQVQEQKIRLFGNLKPLWFYIMHKVLSHETVQESAHFVAVDFTRNLAVLQKYHMAFHHYAHNLLKAMLADKNEKPVYRWAVDVPHTNQRILALSSSGVYLPLPDIQYWQALSDTAGLQAFVAKISPSIPELVQQISDWDYIQLRKEFSLFMTSLHSDLTSSLLKLLSGDPDVMSANVLASILFGSFAPHHSASVIKNELLNWLEKREGQSTSLFSFDVLETPVSTSQEQRRRTLQVSYAFLSFNLQNMHIRSILQAMHKVIPKAQAKDAQKSAAHILQAQWYFSPLYYYGSWNARADSLMKTATRLAWDLLPGSGIPFQKMFERSGIQSLDALMRMRGKKGSNEKIMEIGKQLFSSFQQHNHFWHPMHETNTTAASIISVLHARAVYAAYHGISPYPVPLNGITFLRRENHTRFKEIFCFDTKDQGSHVFVALLIQFISRYALLLVWKENSFTQDRTNTFYYFMEQENRTFQEAFQLAKNSLEIPFDEMRSILFFLFDYFKLYRSFYIDFEEAEDLLMTRMDKYNEKDFMRMKSRWGRLLSEFANVDSVVYDADKLLEGLRGHLTLSGLLKSFQQALQSAQEVYQGEAF